MLQKVLFFTSLLACCYAYASNTAAPINVDNIKMAKEHVVIKGHQITRNDRQGEWRVNCAYVFTNISDKAIDVKMAFPFPIKEQHKKMHRSSLIHDFKVFVTGKALPVTRIKLMPVPKKGLFYKDAYVWNMHFKPYETIIVNHEYFTGVTVNSVVQNKIYYVLKTGKLWQAGKISHALLEIVPNTPTRLCSETDSAEYLKPKPAGMIVMGVGDNKKYVWNLKNFSPESNLELCLLPKIN